MRLNMRGNQRLGGSHRRRFAPKVRALAKTVPGRWQGRLPAGSRHAAEHAWEPAVGRKPPAAVRTEGARDGKDRAGALAGPFARRLPPCG